MFANFTLENVEIFHKMLKVLNFEFGCRKILQNTTSI